MSHDHEKHCHGCEEPTPRLASAELPPDAVTTVLAVTGMDCPDEIATLNRVLGPIAGVHAVGGDLINSRVTVAHSPDVAVNTLIAAITPTGMTARPLDDQGSAPAEHFAKSPRARLIALSGILTGLGLILGWTHRAPEWVLNAIFAAAILSGGWFIFPKAIAAARRFAPDMNLLMLIAVVGAAIIGEWSEGAAVTFLFGLSELLESFSVQRARRAIQSLLALAPDTALLKRGDEFEEVSVQQVALGDIVAVKSGQRIPLDGEIIAGASSVNQAPITGESMPVEKKAGDSVFAGTINGEGSLELRVTKASGDTLLARIVKLVGDAQAQKAPAQRFVDVFARYYTPAVIVVALLVLLLPPLFMGGDWGLWFYRSLVLLVIACPCALVISTPVSIVSGLTAMARRGVLIKGGAHLESIGKLRALAVDKTGTITEGKPAVQEIVTFGDNAPAAALRLAASIDTHSEHPLAKAVVARAQMDGVNFPRADSYAAVTGRGARGTVDGTEYFIGNHRFAHELGVCSPEVEVTLQKIESKGQSLVVVGRKPGLSQPGAVLAILAVGDAIRPGAAAALRRIHEAGVEKIVMLSGDNQRTADAIARQAGIDEAKGDLLPEDKVARVRELNSQYQHVGMIGDGVNDAPAMAVATIGIAMGKAGTDTAIETADVALMQDDLSMVADAIELGRQTLGIIRFNIIFALAIKAVFLLLALVGHTSLWLAIAADTGATLLVIANSLRLLRSRP